MCRLSYSTGTLFQETALFDLLSVANNVGYRLDEETDMPDDQVRRRVEEVLGFVRNGGIYFEGDAAELRRSTDPYLKTFLSGWIPPVV